MLLVTGYLIIVQNSLQLNNGYGSFGIILTAKHYIDDVHICWGENLTPLGV